MKFSVNLYEEELVLLTDFMKKNKIKNKSDAVRKCIKEASKLNSIEGLLLDINNKSFLRSFLSEIIVLAITFPIPWIALNFS